MPPRLNLKGEVFGRLTVTDFHGISKNGKSEWVCFCSCNDKHKFVVVGSDMLSGKTKSCGCLNKEVIKKIGEANKDHGMTASSEYSSWKSMIARCENPNNHNYPLYGGSGLFVDDEFKDFKVFLNYIGHQPKDGKSYSIDRLDNSKGYIKGNIRWATPELQARNKGINSRNNTGVTGVCFAITEGRTYAIATWVENSKRYAKRFNVHNLGIMEAFALACKLRNDKITELNSLGYGYTDNHGK